MTRAYNDLVLASRRLRESTVIDMESHTLRRRPVDGAPVDQAIWNGEYWIAADRALQPDAPAPRLTLWQRLVRRWARWMGDE